MKCEFLLLYEGNVFKSRLRQKPLIFTLSPLGTKSHAGLAHVAKPGGCGLDVAGGPTGLAHEAEPAGLALERLHVDVFRRTEAAAGRGHGGGAREQVQFLQRCATGSGG